MRLVLNAILPVFMIIFLGYFAEKKHFLGQDSKRFLANYVYYFALPPLLFIVMANEPVSKSLNIGFVVSFAASSLILYIIGYCISSFFKSSDIRNSSIRSLAISSPNTAYMGIPILIGLFGNKAVLPVTLSTIILVFITAISIFVLELTKIPIKQNKPIITASKVLFCNPLVISPILGLVVACSKIHLPIFFSSFCHQIGTTAGPCALFAIGQSLNYHHIFTKKIEFSVVAFLKLAAHPLLILFFIHIIGLSGFWAASAFILSSLPSAAIILIVAQKYNTYEESSSALIFETTVISLFTLMIVISIAAYLWPSTFLI